MCAFDIVHYQGYGEYVGKTNRDQRPTAKLAFVDDSGAPSWLPANEFFDWVARAGARLLVLEFLTPPPTLDQERIPPSSLMTALDRVEAMVFTSMPVHVRQARMFNENFYKWLSEPKPANVEEAVQQARHTLWRNRPVNDCAGFGWFALAMRDGTGLPLIAGADQRERTPPRTTEQPSIARLADLVGQESPTRTGDNFSGLGR